MNRVAVWVATLGPVGWWPAGPGTLASALMALAWWWTAPSRTIVLAAAAGITAAGLAVAGAADRDLGPDDGRIVIDEAAGMALALSGVPHGLPGCLVALALFRALDIGKPPPVSWCESVPGGPGVMLDDVVAGAIAAVLGAVAFAVWPSLAG
ncbi:MAG TPA: phosphatidylglycerophosphatase A [Gemmatimonadota bacterium]|nr:phosphatidylglycerophosphatase A [Gemmatimonadota bacterium]